jgi:hypothetical protein
MILLEKYLTFCDLILIEEEAVFFKFYLANNIGYLYEAD